MNRCSILAYTIFHYYVGCTHTHTHTHTHPLLFAHSNCNPSIFANSRGIQKWFRVFGTIHRGCGKQGSHQNVTPGFVANGIFSKTLLDKGISSSHYANWNIAVAQKCVKNNTLWFNCMGPSNIRWRSCTPIYRSMSLVT